MRKQQGYMVILALIFIFIMGVMGTLIAYMFTNRARVNAAVFSGMNAFYIAESGFETISRALTRPSLDTVPTRVGCSNISQGGTFNNVAMGIGEFSVTGSSNFASSSLASGITASATTLAVSSASSFSSQGFIYIDNEIMQYSGISGNTLIGVIRGVNGSTARSHNSGAAVGQFQCGMTVTGAVPTIASPNYQRVIEGSLQLQDGWAVGERSGNNYTFSRWNGNQELKWRSISVPAQGASNRADINAVSMLNYADGLAVGNQATSGFITLHWDGSSWSKNILSGACSGQNLYGVSLVSGSEYCSAIPDGPRFRSGNNFYTM